MNLKQQLIGYSSEFASMLSMAFLRHILPTSDTFFKITTYFSNLRHSFQDYDTVFRITIQFSRLTIQFSRLRHRFTTKIDLRHKITTKEQFYDMNHVLWRASAACKTKLRRKKHFYDGTWFTAHISRLRCTFTTSQRNSQDYDTSFRITAQISRLRHNFQDYNTIFKITTHFYDIATQFSCTLFFFTTENAISRFLGIAHF